MSRLKGKDPGPRVMAVFATMNRREVALECARRLLAQSRPVERVIVADNVSGDGTADALDALGPKIEVIRMPENLGNAGGVEVAMERAFGHGADAVWILDDDSLPRVDALEHLLEAYGSDRIVHPVQIDPDDGGLGWPIQVEGDGGWRLVDSLDGLPSEPSFRSRASWTGALVPRRVRDAVGPVNGALFIRGEDEEYPWRIAEAGFGFLCVRAAVLDHPGPRGLVSWRLAGRRFFFERGLGDWKLYYKVRNMVWLKRRQSGALAGWLVALAYALAMLRFDGWQRARAGVFVRAVGDALADRLGPMAARPESGEGAR